MRRGVNNEGQKKHKKTSIKRPDSTGKRKEHPANDQIRQERRGEQPSNDKFQQERKKGGRNKTEKETEKQQRKFRKTRSTKARM
jgi:hypothetical protein